MIAWLTGTTLGKVLTTFFISMLPVVELRLGLPYGIALGLDYPMALGAALLGNMLPVPFIIVYIHRVFIWLRAHFGKMDAFITRLEDRANLKGETVQKYGPWGLLIFVAIPLPGTGAWTGALVADVLDLRLRTALPAIALGVLIAGIITTTVTCGVIRVFW